MQENPLHQGKNNTQKYDYIFCGMGASSSLLILELFRNGLLKNKKILLLDKEYKNKKDKTFCFWSNQNDSISLHLKSLITKSWSYIELENKKQQSLTPLSYNHVDSSNLYSKIKDLTAQYKWDVIIESVENISKDDQGAYIIIDDVRIRGGKIFDSRTPLFEKPQNGKSHIFQSFVGWTVETKKEGINPEVFRFMDFDIPQQGFTQFVYVLPFSSTKALVEVTRFGSEVINTEQAEELLEKYIKKSYGTFKKIDIEIGCIPMSHSKIIGEPIQGVINLGARNYNIKASTGYAFKNMYYQAFDIAQTLKQNNTIDGFNRNHNSFLKSRFALYDCLLLDILKNKPEYGKPIFLKLLKNIETQKTLKFLDEKTNIFEEISIFIQLPWKPFILALYKQMIHLECFQAIILTILTLCIIFLGAFTSVQSEIGFLLFSLGMILVGIPHGAVDHLLETGSWNLKKAPMFIINYLVLAGVIGVLWLFLPQIALIIFILYSMWHFGQADGKIWGFSSITSFLWGGSVLLYILGTHAQETNTILISMGSIPLPFEIPVIALIPWVLWGLYYMNLSFLITLTWLTLSSQIPLLLAFGIYFIGQHSITGWKHLKIHLHTSNKNIWLQSLPFHGGAWIIGLLFYFFWPLQNSTGSLGGWGIFFIFLACISFPHVIAMHGMYSRIPKI